jgi:polar amino acid transport system substrate-binding protein
MKKIIVFGIIILALGFVGYKYLSIYEQQKQTIDTSLSKIKERGKLIVGTNLPFEPMEYYDQSKKIIGYDIDLINAIASNLGVSVEIKDVPWNGLFDDVKMGKFDLIIDSITMTADRQKEMLFSVPYINAGQVVLVRKENKDINKPEDLKGKKVAVLKNTTCEDAAKLYADLSLIQEYSSQDIAIEHLKNKDADAVVVDYVVAAYTVKKDPSLKIVTNQFTEEFYGIATKLDNLALMNEINNILRGMKRDGQLDQIKNKWLK